MQDQLYTFPICQFVGFKGSGKTTLMNTFISQYEKIGKRVGTIKHHGHGGRPDAVEGTDSFLHMTSGATVSSVAGEDIVQLTINDEHFAINDLIKMYEQLSVDVLLIEGYKEASFPKIVLVRDETDLQLVKQLNNIIAVGVWDDELMNDISNYYTFNIHHIDKNLHQLFDYITVKLTESINLT
ncbi:MAG TPA: molybdopterin-guanine dinucleotide biosynthesis protein B [Bacillota bacterium]|nr:molybdopterin-guanine dinucleotide biosynthesis protein B [Bacillota bacterium]